MSQVFAHQLGLAIRKTNIGAQKIDGTILETYEMVVSIYSMLDKDGRERIFEENFLLVNVKPEIVFGMLFLTMINADVDFQAWNLQWRSYITGNVLLTTRQVELIGKKKFTATAFNLKHKVFEVHVATLSVNPDDDVHLSRRAQVAYLKADEAPTKV